MTTVDRPATSPSDTLDRAGELAATIAARAGEIEAARRVPADLLDELMAAGCFRLLLPPSHGGMGADLSSAMSVYETLARADASVGWTVMIGSSSWCDLVGLPRETFDALLPAGSDVIIAGAFNPTGSITAAGDGFRVTGRWGFASGCEHADWLFGNCVQVDPDNGPQLRMAVFTPEQVVIEDTWRVSGLCGTGSHHFGVDDLFVATDRTSLTLADEPCIDTPIVRIPPPALFSLTIAGVALGIAQGALDDVLALAVDTVPLLAHGPLAGHPLFQRELASADTELRAARSLVYETATDVWTTARGPTPFTPDARARIRATAAWATERAAAIVGFAYRSGGSRSLYSDCPLQRRLRDIHALTQHFLVRGDTLTTAGAILAGQEPDIAMF